MTRKQHNRQVEALILEVLPRKVYVSRAQIWLFLRLRGYELPLRDIENALRRMERKHTVSWRVVSEGGMFRRKEYSDPLPF